jgi:hypothetical protein
MKQLYFLHIPKTAGQFITEAIRVALENNNIKDYFIYNGAFVSEEKLKTCVYIGSHFGTYPIDIIPEIDTVTVLRDPVERSVSQFNFLYEQRYKDLYKEIDGYIARLRFYLFEDENVTGMRNYQARFLCNAADSRRFKSEENFKLVLEESIAPFGLGFPNTWFVGNELTSLNLAKSKLDNMSIVGTSDNLDPVLEKIKVWFLENYDVEIEYLQDRINSSSITEDGVEYTTEDCVGMLTEEEKNTLKQLNSIDQELYEYAKILSM